MPLYKETRSNAGGLSPKNHTQGLPKVVCFNEELNSAVGT